MKDAGELQGPPWRRSPAVLTEGPFIRRLLADPAGGSADPRMAAYFDGQHHPQQALPPRVGYVALASDTVIGYIAGHRTTRYGCAGEVQYFFVASANRRRGIASTLLGLLAGWFQEHGAARVCVNVDVESPAARLLRQPVGDGAQQALVCLGRDWGRSQA